MTPGSCSSTGPRLAPARWTHWTRIPELLGRNQIATQSTRAWLAKIFVHSSEWLLYAWPQISVTVTHVDHARNHVTHGHFCTARLHCIWYSLEWETTGRRQQRNASHSPWAALSVHLKVCPGIPVTPKRSWKLAVRTWVGFRFENWKPKQICLAKPNEAMSFRTGWTD